MNLQGAQKLVTEWDEEEDKGQSSFTIEEVITMTARNAVAVDVLEETASCDASLGKQSACTTANSRTSGRGAAAADPYLQVNVGFLSKDARTGPLIHTINFVLTFLLLATGCVLAVLTTLQSAASYFRIPAAAGTSYDLAETRSAFSPPPVNPLPLLEKIKTGELETLNIPQTRQQPNLQNTLKKMISTPAEEDPTRITNPQEKPKNSSSSLSVRLHEDMKPSSFLYHNMEDDELLHKAASMQQLQDHISCNPGLQQNSTVQKNSPRRLQAKIAFLFLTREALPLQALWELYFKGHEGMYSIYVHAHPNYSFPNVSSSSVFFGRNIPSKVNNKFLKLDFDLVLQDLLQVLLIFFFFLNWSGFCKLGLKLWILICEAGLEKFAILV